MNARTCPNSAAVLASPNMPTEPISHVITLWWFLPAMLALTGLAEMTPNAADAWTAAGALLGTFVAVLEANQKRRQWTQTASIVIASSFCGTTLPGVLAAWLLSPERAHSLQWQMWALAGFVCAIPGWGLVLGVLQWAKRAPATVENRLAKLTDTKPNEPQN